MTINDESPSVAHSWRLCDARVRDTAVDLGMSSSCERGPRPQHLSAMSKFCPHHSPVFQRYGLVQLEQYANGEHSPTEHSHFSPFSESWVQH